MRATMPVIHCDGDDGDCGAWDTDYYVGNVDSVGDVRITEASPAPGWTYDRKADFHLCPQCQSGGAS
jgi:hypothetical protein